MESLYLAFGLRLLAPPIDKLDRNERRMRLGMYSRGANLNVRHGGVTEVLDRYVNTVENGAPRSWMIQEREKVRLCYPDAGTAERRFHQFIVMTCVGNLRATYWLRQAETEHGHGETIR